MRKKGTEKGGKKETKEEGSRKLEEGKGRKKGVRWDFTIPPSGGRRAVLPLSVGTSGFRQGWRKGGI